MRLGDLEALEHELVTATRYMTKEQVLDIAYRVNKAPTIDAVPVEAVAQMFLDFTGDKCPCNFNNNDEWLPLVCEYEAEGKCPDPDDMLGCWKQYIKHYGERKDGEG